MTEGKPRRYHRSSAPSSCPHMAIEICTNIWYILVLRRYPNVQEYIYQPR